jgi:small subunit ribosomal protein S2
MKKFKESYDFVKELVAKGGTILFVGTKNQAQDIIKEEAKRCGAFYVKHKWLGGMLTNFSTIRKNLNRLNELERMEKDGMFEVLPSGEVKKLKKEKDKLTNILEGIRDMNKLPDAVFVIDLKKEAIALAEAKKLHIPVVAVVDTNCDPDLVTYCIPGNDDAIRGIKLFVNQIAEAVLEGKSMIKKQENLMPEEAVQAAAQPESVIREISIPSVEQNLPVQEISAGNGPADPQGVPIETQENEENLDTGENPDENSGEEKNG